MTSLEGSRPVWSNRVESILVSVGYVVGLGNVWRFPYVCYNSGGGAYLIPYFILTCLVVIPFVFLEFSLGQYTQLGPIQAIYKCCPLMKGVGLSTVVLTIIVCSYNNTAITWALYYLFNTFRASLPWSQCNGTWNIPDNCSMSGQNASHTQTASQQFFDRKLLKATEGIENIGHIRWELFGTLLCLWIIIYFCTFKGIKSTGKVVYFTALFPYVVLLVLLINNIRLPGALDGIILYLKPRWNKLLDIQVWIDASGQIFYSIGVGMGVLISTSSHNKFDNNLLRDALIVSLANSATSIFAGFAIFSGVGYMAHIHGLDINNLAVGGPGLVFVVYPEVFSTLPVPQLWAFLFFLMLLTLGLDCQTAHVDLLVTTVIDTFGSKGRILCLLKRKESVTAFICLLVFLSGIPCITQGGIYIFQLFDHSIGIPMALTALLEIVVISWIFGVRRLSIMVEEMLKKPPSIFFKACWMVISPLMIMVILVSSLIQHTALRYGENYYYPQWANAVAWVIALVATVWIPLGAIHELYNRKGSLLTRLKSSVTPRMTMEDTVHSVPMEPYTKKQCLSQEEKDGLVVGDAPLMFSLEEYIEM